MNLLEVKNVCKTYGSKETAVNALKNVSFSVPKGEYVAIVGESGSGKSTLLNMIGALDIPTAGKVFIDGMDIFSMNDQKLTVFRRRNIGFIFQAFNLIPELTVEQNIIFPVLLDHQKPDKKYLEELLTVLNLKERRNHLPSQLSGGQQQRVAIGRALITSETYPSDNEVIVSGNILDIMEVHLGDTIMLTMPNGGSKVLRIVGFHQDTAVAFINDAVVLFTNFKTFEDIQRSNGEVGAVQYYLQFQDHTNLRKAITRLKEEYSLADDSVSENTYILAMHLNSGNSYIMGLYLVAAVLAVMVLLAGVFMIAASLNSNVLQRTGFYGMLRCLGASKQQIMKLVRLEALNWCKFAIPLGLVFGVILTWGLCLFLHLWVGDEFKALPLWKISPIGILCGGISGFVTAWIASATPAKKHRRCLPSPPYPAIPLTVCSLLPTLFL